jgi:hypothetical protein
LARSLAASKHGTVRTAAEFDKLVSAGRVDKRTIPGYVEAETIDAGADTDTSWVAAAKAITKARRNANTIGKKTRELKRPPTDPTVLAQAKEFLSSLGDIRKVEVVRAAASWTNADGAGIQRRDAFALIHDLRPDVRDHTISTQWQLTKAGRVSSSILSNAD